jgi:DNA-binding response OmpR family regulator
MDKRHILVIDDDPLFRRLVGGWIAQMAMDVLYAHDGDEGRELARRFHPDLILLDYHMPSKNGIEVAALLKDEAETKDIPIILLTNEDLSLEAQQSLKDIGIVDYLHKSISYEDFAIRVKKVFEAPAS